MSDTPRTDAATKEYYDEMYDHDFMYVETGFSKELERENDRLAKQCVRNVEEIGALRTEVRKLERVVNAAKACLNSWREDEGSDAKRLEFLMDSSFVEITREEIDEAMEAEQS